MRVSSLLNKLSSESVANQPEWTIPKRYSKTTPNESQTIANIIRILSLIYQRIQNKHLNIIIKSFLFWSLFEKSDVKKNAYDIYNDLLAAEDDTSAYIPNNFDEMLLDIIMYSDSTMVEESLKLLMIHKSNKQILQSLSNRIQLVFTDESEKMFHFLSTNLRKMENYTETYEIWFDISIHENLYIAKDLLHIIIKIINCLRSESTDSKTLSNTTRYLVNEEVQKLLLNLDAMSCFMLVLETLYDGGREVPSKPIKDIMIAMTHLICWFVKANEDNQQIAFQYFDWFKDRIDDNIHSSYVLREILSGNKGK